MATVRVGSSIEEHGIAMLPTGAIAAQCENCTAEWITEELLPVFCPFCGKELPSVSQEFIHAWEQYNSRTSN